MSKVTRKLVLLASMVVIAVGCNKKDENNGAAVVPGGPQDPRFAQQNGPWGQQGPFQQGHPSSFNSIDIIRGRIVNKQLTLSTGRYSEIQTDDSCLPRNKRVENRKKSGSLNRAYHNIIFHFDGNGQLMMGLRTPVGEYISASPVPYQLEGRRGAIRVMATGIPLRGYPSAPFVDLQKRKAAAQVREERAEARRNSRHNRRYDYEDSRGGVDFNVSLDIGGRDYSYQTYGDFSSNGGGDPFREDFDPSNPQHMNPQGQNQYQYNSSIPGLGFLQPSVPNAGVIAGNFVSDFEGYIRLSPIHPRMHINYIEVRNAGFAGTTEVLADLGYRDGQRTCTTSSESTFSFRLQ